MADALRFDRSHPGHYGQAVELSPLVRRVVANNPGPFTFTGTVTHIIGRRQVAILDPGPDDGDHLAALLAATAGETITHILVSHTHRDHTDGVNALHEATGAPILGCGPHVPSRPLHPGEADGLDARTDTAYRPGIELAHGDMVRGQGWTLETVATPGHTRNHLAFALPQEGALFPGDHVMAWSTTIVAPPDGSMRDYRASLRSLLARSEDTFYPAHGPSLTDAHIYTAALLRHRDVREREILEALGSGGTTIPEIVRAVYADISPSLAGAAGLSVLAHIEELIESGRVTGEFQSDQPARFRVV